MRRSPIVEFTVEFGPATLRPHWLSATSIRRHSERLGCKCKTNGAESNALAGRHLNLATATLLSSALGREVQVVKLDDPGVPLLEEIVRDGIIVFEANAGRGARWRSRVLSELETDRPWFRRMSKAWLDRVADKGLRRG